MSDVNLMIKIPEEIKKHCDTPGVMIQAVDIIAMRKAIQNGILVPQIESEKELNEGTD